MESGYNTFSDFLLHHNVAAFKNTNYDPEKCSNRETRNISDRHLGTVILAGRERSERTR